MGNKYLSLIVLIFVFTFLNSYSSVESKKLCKIAVDKNVLNAPKVIETSDFIEEINYIRLKTSDSTLIGKIDKVVKNGNFIYVLDRFKAKPLFIFDSSGNCISKIGRYGSGPGEVKLISDFTIDTNKNELLLWDNLSSKLIKYSLDGLTILEEKRLKAYFTNLVHLSNETFAFYNQSPFGTSDDWFNKFKLVFSDTKLNSIETIVPIESWQSKLFVSGFNPFSINNNQVLYSPLFSNTINKIDEDLKVVTEYEIDFGSKNIPQEVFECSNITEFIGKVEQGKFAFTYGGCNDSGNYLVFPIINNSNELQYCYYNKQKKTVFSDNGVEDNLAFSIAYTRPLG